MYKMPTVPSRDYSDFCTEDEILAALPEAPSGMQWRASIRGDYISGTPWEDCDGHGVVTNWENRDKHPGELILNEDRHAKRFYDFAESVRIAKRDGWSCEGMPEGVSAGERAAIAARQDFEYLQAWCTDEWQYVGVSVWLETDEGEEIEGQGEYHFAIWGLESFATTTITETARELAMEAMAAYESRINPVCEMGV